MGAHQTPLRQEGQDANRLLLRLCLQRLELSRKDLQGERTEPELQFALRALCEALAFTCVLTTFQQLFELEAVALRMQDGVFKPCKQACVMAVSILVHLLQTLCVGPGQR